MNRQQPKKLSSLPSFDDDDVEVEFDLNLSNSIVEGSFLSTASCSNSDETDDDLPVGILKTNDKSKKWKPGDLAWIKHRRYCFWPCYIKAVSGNKISALFICYHKFDKNDRSMRYSFTSKCIKKYRANSKQLIEEGRAFYADAKLNKEDKPGCSLASFNEAVDLAEAYTLYHSNGEFASKEEELDFFRTNGVSLYLKKSTDDTSTALSQLATPDEISLDESLNNSFQISSPRERDDLEDADASTPHSKNPPNSDIISSTPSASLPMNEDPYLLNGATPTTKSRKRKRCSSLDLFNRKASKIVNYISSGNCNQYLLDIFNLKIPSVRMQAYFKVWDKKSSTPKGKNLKTEMPYFCDEKQLESVCLHLQSFINLNLKDVVGLTRKDELLFSVLLPEVTIYGIHKVYRKPLSTAIAIYEKGFSGSICKIDPLLATPLTDEERTLVERRNEEFLKKLKYS